MSVIVTDNGTPALSRTNQFTLTVREVNSAPTVNPISSQTINELQPFGIFAQAFDTDFPAQTITYSLLNPPAGATINSGSGEFSWTPSETQGGSVNTITVVATDNGSPALSVTNQLTLTVQEGNAAPVLGTLQDYDVFPGQLITFTATATDSDLPAQTLTYSLDLGAPNGAAITSDGNFTWTPSAADAPSTNTITIRVGDGGVFDFGSFEVIVRSAEQPLIVPSITAGDEFQGSWNSQPSATYRVLYRDSLSTGTWQQLKEVTATGATSTFTDPLPPTGTRFYRLELRTAP